MRTNAIMKNVELKACLALWQYIESYDKVGYEINVENSAVKPEQEYIEDFYKIVVLNLLLFRSYTGQNSENMEELKTKKQKKLAPKFLKKFSEEISGDYSVIAEAVPGYLSGDGEFKLKKSLPADIRLVFDEVNNVIEIEKAYIAKREAERLKAEQYRIEEERRLEEQRRIEEARKAELERIRLQKEEEERRLQEMLEQKRREQEEEERERERQEQERLARLEEMRKREEEERLRREEEERIAAERARVAENENKMRAELGEAEGLDSEKLKKEEFDEELEKKAYEEVTEEEIEQVKASMEETPEEEREEFEDPRAVAARLKVEQQKQEKERRDAERAQRLKAERTYFESKPFRDIYKEYSHNPIYAIPRLIRYILSMVFGIIPEDTDNPAFKVKRAEIEERKRLKEEEKQKRNAMEVYYRKYAGTFKYRFLRAIDDYKFKKRKRQQMKDKPKPKYVPPNRTPEEQLAIDTEMKRLYKEYHVSAAEKVRRQYREFRRSIDEDRKSKLEEQSKQLMTRIENGEDPEKIKADKGVNKAVSVILTVLIFILAVFTAYVMICTARNKAVSVFGKSVLRVITGSMEPSIHTGDYILVEKTDTSQLKEDDIIAFYSEQSDIYGMLVTHRITEIKDDGSFVTKGDANEVEDSITVRPDQVVGKYTGKARFFIWVSNFGSKNNGVFADRRNILLICVIIPIGLVAVYELRTLAKLGIEMKRSETDYEQLRQKLIREAIEKEKQRLAEENYQAETEVSADEPREDNEKEDD